MGFLKIMMVIFFVSSCGKNFSNILHPGKIFEVKKEEELAQALEGTVIVDEKEVDLSFWSDKPTILLFATEFCSYCLEEKEAIVETLQFKKMNPNGVNIVSIFVDQYESEFVNYIKEDQEIPWTVAYDKEFDIDANLSPLFDRYCEEALQTPCIVIWTPKEGVVLRHNGKVDIQTILELTGPFEVVEDE